MPNRWCKRPSSVGYYLVIHGYSYVTASQPYELITMIRVEKSNKSWLFPVYKKQSQISRETPARFWFDKKHSLQLARSAMSISCQPSGPTYLSSNTKAHPCALRNMPVSNVFIALSQIIFQCHHISRYCPGNVNFGCFVPIPVLLTSQSAGL